MNKFFFTSLFLIFFSCLTVCAQFTFEDVKFWVGSGSDSVVLVVDFQDGTDDSCYAWGYLFERSTTGEDILAEVIDADRNFSLIGGGFEYNSHPEISPSIFSSWHYWNGSAMDSLSAIGFYNSIINHPIYPGDFFVAVHVDMRYLNPDFGQPIPAYDPEAFTFADIKHYTGNGMDTAMLVVDFMKDGTISSFAWGFLFDGTITGKELLRGVAEDDSLFDVFFAAGFINDITYGELVGYGGAPDFWATWRGTNLGNLRSKDGINTIVRPGEIFGCSYTDFNPMLRPDYPYAVPLDGNIGVHAFEQSETFNCYPIPARDQITVSFPSAENRLIELYDMGGSLLHSVYSAEMEQQIELYSFSSGIYLIKVGQHTKKIVVR